MMQRFEDDLDAVVADTCSMADLATDMIERAVQSFADGDTEMAEAIVADQALIERMDDDIEAAAIRVLQLYQPTAGDVRTVATVLKSITHLERIAKYGTNIANATLYLHDRPSYEVVELIRPVGDRAVKLVRIVVDGLKTGDLRCFERLDELDDKLDQAMRSSVAQVVEFINTHEGSADVCTYYISVLKFLERVGDHACKMAEKVHFMITGERATYE